MPEKWQNNRKIQSKQITILRIFATTQFDDIVVKIGVFQEKVALLVEKTTALL